MKLETMTSSSDEDIEGEKASGAERHGRKTPGTSATRAARSQKTPSQGSNNSRGPRSSAGTTTTTTPATATKTKDARRSPEDSDDSAVPKRRCLALTPCCGCTRFSTCAVGTRGKGSGCDCIDAGRQCSSCACFANCRNKTAPKLPATTGTLRSFFRKSSQATSPQPTRPSTPTESIPTLPPTAIQATRAIVARDTSPPSPDQDVPTTINQLASDTPSEFTAPVPPPPPPPHQEEPLASTVVDPTAPGDAVDQPIAAAAPQLPANSHDPLHLTTAVECPPTIEAAAGPPPAPPQAAVAPAPPAAPAPVPAHPATAPSTELGADLPGFSPTPADLLLDKVYGDHPHRNDGRHLDGGIQDDKAWQRRWKRIAQLSTTHYSVPKGRVGRRFIQMLTNEFNGVRERRWNSERPLVFATAILQTTQGVRSSQAIRSRLAQRMDLWDQGHFVALVDDVEAELNSRVGSTRRDLDDETLARAFNAKVLSGRLRVAVRFATNRDGGGVLQPDDPCTKTGRPVLEVLRDKHPAMRVPDATSLQREAFESYDSTPEPVPLNITPEIVEKVACRLSGGAGPSGTDSVDLRNWLLRFGAESAGLRRELALHAEWLANTHPPWAAYRALMAGRLVALDKQPGVRPVGIGEIYRRLMAKSVLQAIGHQATSACGNLNLCAGLAAGIEGAIHALETTWQATTSAPANLDPAEGVPPRIPTAHTCPPQPAPPTPTEGVAPATSSAAPAALLIDARNGFNELSRLAMLWTVRHLWKNGARFAFNCYRHEVQLIVRRPSGHPCYTLLSQEGVTQGDPLSMVLYGLALVPLAKRLRNAVPTLLQPWYADDSAMMGQAKDIATAMSLLLQHGPERGYFPEPAKSILICRPTDEANIQSTLSAFSFQYRQGSRYVGGYLGDRSSRNQWLDPQVQKWTAGVKTLARIARHFPQTAYAGLSKSLQAEWQYLQRVTPDCGSAFSPVEDAIRTAFLPALLGSDEPVADALRTRITLPVKCSGLGLPNPVDSASHHHSTSRESTSTLSKSICQNADLHVGAYLHDSHQARRTGRMTRLQADQAVLESLAAASRPIQARQLRRACDTGAWLTAMPDRLNGTELAADEFRDSLRLRLGLSPIGLPTSCDGCNQRFTVEHALSCKKGGLITLRHNDVAAEWHHLCGQAFTASAVSDEPLIHTSRAAQAGTAAPRVTQVDPELRGDVAVHGFWKRGITTIFDARITDTDAPTYRGQDPAKVLAKHEKEKKEKYLQPCLDRRRHFTPLVFSVDGLRGAEATAATKRLAACLAHK